MSKSSSAALSSSLGQALWAKMPKANAELFALTYGSLVMELLRDYDNVEEVNGQLERIGHSIGVRIVDEFLSKATIDNNISCANMRETAEVIAKIGFRMFLGISCDVANFGPDGRSFSLFLYDNPLAIFVELPTTGDTNKDDDDEDMSQLKYSNLYCGVIRGSLEQVNLRVQCFFVRDVLRGEEVNEIRVELKEILLDGAGDDYKEE